MQAIIPLARMYYFCHFGDSFNPTLLRVQYRHHWSSSFRYSVLPKRSVEWLTRSVTLISHRHYHPHTCHRDKMCRSHLYHCVLWWVRWWQHHFDERLASDGMRYWSAIISSHCDAGMGWWQHHLDALLSSSNHTEMAASLWCLLVIIKSLCNAAMEWWQHHFDKRPAIDETMAASWRQHHFDERLACHHLITLWCCWESGTCHGSKNLLVEAAQTLNTGSIWMYQGEGCRPEKSVIGSFGWCQ